MPSSETSCEGFCWTTISFWWSLDCQPVITGCEAFLCWTTSSFLWSSDCKLVKNNCNARRNTYNWRVGFWNQWWSILLLGHQFILMVIHYKTHGVWKSYPGSAIYGIYCTPVVGNLSIYVRYIVPLQLGNHTLVHPFIVGYVVLLEYEFQLDSSTNHQPIHLFSGWTCQLTFINKTFIHLRFIHLKWISLHNWVKVSTYIVPLKLVHFHMPSVHLFTWDIFYC